MIYNVHSFMVAWFRCYFIEHNYYPGNNIITDYDIINQI